MSVAVHGHRRPKKSPTYISWDSMIARCHRPTHPFYKDYGGRGIRVCDRWRGRDGFVHFLIDMGERPAERSIDRIDVNGDYEPGNCRWADKFTQRWNRRDMAMAATDGTGNEWLSDHEPDGSAVLAPEMPF